METRFKQDMQRLEGLGTKAQIRNTGLFYLASHFALHGIYGPMHSQAPTIQTSAIIHRSLGMCGFLVSAIVGLWMACSSQQPSPPRAAADHASMYEKCENGDKVSCTEYRTAAAPICANGDGAACFNLGLLWFDGLGGETDPAKAFEFHGKSCNAKHMPGCFNVAASWEAGLAGQTDATKAREFYALACDGEYAQACNNLATFWNEGTGGLKDPTKARVLHDKGCRLGGGNSCYGLAVAMENGSGGPTDIGGALSAYENACERGTLAACNNLGDMLAAGRGAPSDHARARGLFAQACEGGHHLACTNLGITMASGRGGQEKDYTAARTVFEKACTGGEPHACLQLADLFERGLGGARDTEKALALLEKNCATSDGESCLQLGMLHTMHGAQDKAKPAYKRACELGLQAACGRVGGASGTPANCEKVIDHTLKLMKAALPSDDWKDFDRADAIRRCRGVGLQQKEAACFLAAKTFDQLQACD